MTRIGVIFGVKVPTDMKLEDQLRNVIRLKHYSVKTEESYVGWYRRFDSVRPLAHLTPRGAA